MTTPLDTIPNVSTPFSSAKSNLKDNPISPRGRFTRMSYLAWLFISSMVYTCILFIAFGFGIYAVSTSGLGLSNLSVFTSTPSGWCATLILIFSVIVFTVISVCISIRRLHDMNQSGWLFLLALIPVLGIFFLLYLYVAKGDLNDNKYGPYRETEQTEKVLGILFAIIVSVYTLATLGSALVLPKLIEQKMNGQVMDEEAMVVNHDSRIPIENNDESISDIINSATDDAVDDVESAATDAKNDVEEELDSTITRDSEENHQH